MKRHFIYTETKRTISRTYGGSNYTLSVYEMIDNEPVFIGEVKACTRGHKGEIHEAYTVVFNHLSKEEQNRIEETAKSEQYKNYGFTSYYSWQYMPELFGISLKQL